MDINQNQNTLNNRGMVLVTFSILLVPIVIFLAFAIDLAEIARTRMALQKATDATVLSLVSARAKTGFDDFPAEKVVTHGNVVFRHNLWTNGLKLQGNGGDVVAGNADYDANGETFSMTASRKVPLFFSKVMGQSNQQVQTTSTLRLRTNVYVVMIDVSGSMNCAADGSNNCQCNDSGQPNYCTNITTKLDIARDGVRRLYTMAARGDYVIVTLFSTRARVVYSDFVTRTPDEFMAEINLDAGVFFGSSNTNLEDAMYESWKAVLASSANGVTLNSSSDISWILLTDGAPNSMTLMVPQSVLRGDTGFVSGKRVLNLLTYKTRMTGEYKTLCLNPLPNGQCPDDPNPATPVNENRQLICPVAVVDGDGNGDGTVEPGEKMCPQNLTDTIFEDYYSLTPPIKFDNNAPAADETAGYLYRQLALGRTNPFLFYTALNRATVEQNQANVDMDDSTGQIAQAVGIGFSCYQSYYSFCERDPGFNNCHSLDLSHSSQRRTLDELPGTTGCFVGQGPTGGGSAFTNAINCNLRRPAGIDLWNTNNFFGANSCLYFPMRPPGIRGEHEFQSMRFAFNGVFNVGNFWFTIPRQGEGPVPAVEFKDQVTGNGIDLFKDIRDCVGVAGGIPDPFHCDPNNIQLPYELPYDAAIMMADYLRKHVGGAGGPWRSSRLYVIGIGRSATAGNPFYLNARSDDEGRKDAFLARLANDPFAPKKEEPIHSATGKNYIPAQTYSDASGVSLFDGNNYCPDVSPPESTFRDHFGICGVYYPTRTASGVASLMQSIVTNISLMLR